MHELIVDNFAGGGGASTGIELALGRSPDYAINHDAAALAMHAANHPATAHISKNIWQIDPLELIGRRPVGLAWFSPDCKHFSRAKGGKPVARNIRDLAWTVVLWARRVRPRVIILENVTEFRDWGPLVDHGGGKWLPCPDRRGQTFERWVGELRRLGYRVEWRELRACDYGAPTIRKRLFLVARRDGLPIVWPEPTHADPDAASGLKPWRTAARIIDWSLPCPSIFLTAAEGRAIGVNRPLAEATMTRIAKGVQRYVIGASQPFIVSGVHGTQVPHIEYGQHGGATRDIQEPLHTITASRKDQNILVSVHATKFAENSIGSDMGKPLHTVMAGASRHGLVAVHLSRQFGASVGSGAEEPIGTITAGGGGKTALVAAFLAQHNAGPRAPFGRGAGEPLSTVTATGSQQAVVAAELAAAASSPAGGARAAQVQAFLIKYYGQGGQDQDCGSPLHTIPTRDRFSLVTVHGEPYRILDIGMRMLTARELFRAQGFPESYIIDPVHNGRPLTKTEQVRMCGNSVSPLVAAALVHANYSEGAADRTKPARRTDIAQPDLFAA